MKGSVARGAGYLTRGARLLNHPSLRPFVLIPLVINILIFGSLIGIGFSYMSDLMDWMLSRIPALAGLYRMDFMATHRHHSEPDNRLSVHLGRSDYRFTLQCVAG